MPIDSHLNYLQKHAFCAPQISTVPKKDLGIVVVIPATDELNILRTLESLAACGPCGCAVEVIVVVNGSEARGEYIRERNQQTFNLVNGFAQGFANADLQFHALHFPDLPQKHAGVGLARKIGMDEAVHRFGLAENPLGIIVSLDADAVVEPHYFAAIAQYFGQNRHLQSCTIAFQYEPDDEADACAAEAILRIELAERILVAGLRHAGHPYAYHTLGAAMAVRASAYQAQAGMNRRKAGEDFDFLQKFIELGVHGDCNATTVHVSGRQSQRKPGGIGQRVWQYCEEPNPEYPAFALGGFQELAEVMPLVPTWFALDETSLGNALAQFPPAFRGFMQAQGFVKSVLEIQKYTTNAAAFEKRFFRWFHSTRTFLYLGYCRDFHFPNAPIWEVGNAMRDWILGNETTKNEPLGGNAFTLGELLVWFRNH
jgi:Glycosyltransferase like family 2